MKSKYLIINSTLILITIAVINTILHELSHFLVALYYNLKPVLHKNYVKVQLEGTPLQQMFIAGPFFSLIFGKLMNL